MAKEDREFAWAESRALPRTRLLDPGAIRQDDDRLLAVIGEIPVAGGGRCEGFRMGLLNEAGQLYREVLLRGDYEVVLFTARMNACGFVRQVPGATLRDEGFDSLFARTTAFGPGVEGYAPAQGSPAVTAP